MSLEVKKVESCVIIRMKDGQNIITQVFIQRFHALLDTVERYPDAKCVVTVGDGKYYSTGVDIAVVRSPDPSEFLELLSNFQKLLARVLTFPLVTVAAINGHCFGGGAMLALAHDYRVMRKDRGWFSIPIVKLGRTLPTGLVQLAKSKIPQPELHVALALSKQYTAEEAKDARIIHQVSSHEELYRNAIMVAVKLAGEGLDRLALCTIKNDLYCDVFKLLNKQYSFHSHL